jgi:hypothetical protein
LINCYLESLHTLSIQIRSTREIHWPLRDEASDVLVRTYLEKRTGTSEGW